MKTKAYVVLFFLLQLALFGGEKKLEINQQPSFTENKGQVRDQNNNGRGDILFSGFNGQMSYHFKKDGFSYQQYRTDTWKSIEDPNTKEKRKIPDETTIYRLDLDWINSNKNVEVTGEVAVGGTNNYKFSGSSNAINDVKNYKDLYYRNLYEGIDAKWYYKNGQLKYDYMVAAGADYKQIRVKIAGQHQLRINKKGELIITTPLGKIVEQRPLVIQNGRSLPARWILKNNILSFEISGVNNSLPFVIDPLVRIWGTYYGGNSTEYLYSTTVDASGNVYITGSSGASGTVIVTSGAYQTSTPASLNAFLVKFNSSGVRQWGTYFGGSYTEIGKSLAYDNSGNIYMTGWSQSTSSVATVGAHQTTYGGGTYDGFLAKFSTGGALQWATYYGGSNMDYANACAADASGNVYVVGYTQSTDVNVIGTSGAYEPNYLAAGAFLVKFNSSGVRQWGTYYGGANEGNACAVDGSGNVYLVGTSPGYTWAVTAGAHQSTYGGNYDALLVKFNSGGARQWATFYGGGPFSVTDGEDHGYGCATDASGNVYLAGSSSTFTGTSIATSGSQQSTNGGGFDAFLAKFNSSGVRQWGTYCGGSGDDAGKACCTDASSNVYLAGDASYYVNFVTTGAFQTAFGGGTDAFLSKYNSSGARQWGTLYGGNQNDNGFSCAEDGSGNVYLAGAVRSAGLSSMGAFQTSLGGAVGGDDGFLVCFRDCAFGTPTVTANSPLCTSNNLNLTSAVTSSVAVTYSWSGPAAYTSSSQNPNITNVNTTRSGNYSVTVSDGFGCYQSASVSVYVDPIPTISAVSATICSGESYTISPTGAYNYTITGGSFVVSPGSTTSYSIRGTSFYGCPASNTFVCTVTVKTSPSVSITPSSTAICSGATVTLTASGASTYLWNSGSTATFITPSPSGTTSRTVTGTAANGCTDVAVATITVLPLPSVTITPSSSVICSGKSTTLTASGASTYTWNTGSTATVYAITPSVTTNYTLTGTSVSGCTDNVVQTVSVNASPTVNISSTGTVICSGKTTTLTAGGANTYTWSTGSTATVYAVTPSVTTTYTLTGTTAASGCTDNVVQTVSVNASPTVNISSTGTVICSGKTTTLTAGGANTYTWSGGSTATVYAVTPSVTTIYTLTGTTAASGCTDNVVQTVSVNASPTVAISSSAGTVICSGKTTSLTASGASTYTWNTGSTATVYAVTPSVTTSYTLTGTTAASGCTDNIVQTVSVNVSPTVSIANTGTVLCSGKTTTLTASGAATYSWNTGSTATVYAVTPSVTTAYTLTGITPTSGCTNSVVQTVSVNAIPALTISSTGTVICSGKSTTLTAGGANSYTWNTGSTATVYTVTPSVTTNYTLTGTTSVSGCTNTSVQTVSVNPTPTVSISSTGTILCSGNTSTLTAAGASSYSWNTGSTATVYAVSPSATTVYTLTGTSSGCTNSVVQTVSVNPNPTVTISSTGSVICSGKTTTLTASGASTYTWSGGPSTASYTVGPTATTLYSVTGTSTNNCTGTAVQNVSVNALPVLSVSPSSTVICSGKVTTLTASGAVSYTWSGGPSNAVYAATPSATTIYTVTGTGANNCTNTATQNILVNASPALTITPTATLICAAGTVTLTASGANTYSWSGGPSTAVYTISPLTSTSYTLTGTNTVGNCTSTAVQNVSVVAVVVLTISPSSTVICTGNTATLTAIGAATYTWTGGPLTGTYAVSPLTNTSYTVTGTAGSCTNSAVQSISVNASPVLTITPAAAITLCAGSTTTLSASGANTYTWTGGPATAGYTVNPTSTTVYTVVGTTAVSGCTNSAVKSISVNALPALTITPSSTVICAGSTATLTASGATSYTWAGGPAAAVRTVNPLASANYTVTGTNSTTGCSNTAVQSVSVNPLPLVTIVPGATAICAGNSTTLTAAGATSYSWTGGPGTASYSMSPLSTTGFTVTGVLSGCTNTAVATVTVNQIPTITVNNGFICTGGTTTLTAGGASTYSWSTGASTSSIAVSPSTNTSYTVTGTDVNSCVNTATTSVNVASLLNVNIVPTSTAICVGNAATLTANGASTFTWNNASTSSSIVVSPTLSTTYSVIGASGAGCSNTAVQFITVNPLPTLSISGGTFICAGSPNVLTAGGAATYTWSTGANLPVITVSPSITTVYTVSGTNAFNCSNSSTFQVLTTPVVTPAICLVTVDSASINNEIYWEKTSYPQADTFIVLRNTSGSSYTPIARIPKTAYSSYVDTNRSVGLFNGNPNFTSYKYKLQFVDSCGTLSPMSPYHESVFIQDNQTGNFTWNYYFIEGVGPVQTVSYILWRENVLTGITTTVGGTAGTAFTDPQYSSLALTGNVKWYVSTAGFSCNPSLREAGVTNTTANKTKTKSNNTNERQFPVGTGIRENKIKMTDIKIYPNPAENRLRIELGSTHVNVKINLTDLSGRIVFEENVNGLDYEINTENIKNGVYFVKVLDSKGLVKIQKIIVQHQ